MVKRGRSMASITKRGNAWRVRVVRRGHEPICKTFAARRDAEAWAATVEADIARGTYRKQTGEKTTLGELLTRYRENVTPRKRGARVETYRINALLATDSHARKLVCRFVSGVTPADVAKWRDGRLKVATPSTVQKEMALLSSVFAVAAQEWGFEGLLNPFKAIRRPKVHNARDRRITPLELEAICDATGSPELALLLRLGVETGARRSELLSLRWSGIDLKTRTARLESGDTKNGHARTLPLSPGALALLQSMPRRLDGGALFSLRPDSVSQAFRRAVDRARRNYGKVCQDAGKVADPTYLVGLRFHDSRHEACSRLAEKGLSTLEISAVSGHRTLQLLSRYVHLKPEALAQKLAATA